MPLAHPQLPPHTEPQGQQPVPKPPRLLCSDWPSCRHEAAFLKAGSSRRACCPSLPGGLPSHCALGYSCTAWSHCRRNEAALGEAHEVGPEEGSKDRQSALGRAGPPDPSTWPCSNWRVHRVVVSIFQNCCNPVIPGRSLATWHLVYLFNLTLNSDLGGPHPRAGTLRDRPAGIPEGAKRSREIHKAKNSSKEAMHELSQPPALPITSPKPLGRITTKPMVKMRVFTMG